MPTDASAYEQADMLAAVEGDVQIARLAAQQFLAQGEALPDRLRAALEAGDAVQVARLAHEIKGMASMLGANALAAQAAALEGAPHGLQAADAEPLRREWRAVARVLTGFIAG